MNRVLHNIHLSQALTKTYRKYGLTNDEFIVLNSYFLHEGFYHSKIDWFELSDTTGMSAQDLKGVFWSLADRKKIIFDGDSIDNQALYQSLNRIQEAEKSISQRISESINLFKDMGYNNNKHMGYVVLIPYQEGIAVTSQMDEGWTSRSAEMWTKEDMLRLSDEIRTFAEKVDQNYINKYNKEVEERQELQLQIEQEKREQREEKKRQQSLPKPGFVVLYRDTNNRYYFTYTTSLPLKEKIERIKFEKGDAIAIIHTFETSHTLKFYHYFVKDQFSNRRIKDNPDYYALTDEDVLFIKEEKFPSNAMEWMVG
ncbi:hypothetical protein QP794_24000 [Paenibacillus sp. UMB7766-LJ446]|uniref:hypothetical protein n=1 Tax=Paenibacillus sp. UMB7766-LJ446 TaxID=3046313 RepID=UPI00254EC17D|nr:hypothetical protein [Paenibacillus sp. UMB7766-LJ446]MDK8193156.1 hypothetical protein [Paenibacillus sp. UMB7766-LJ446]